MRAVRSLIVIAAVAAILIPLTPHASASRKWCRRDPVVMIAGTAVNIEVATPEENLANVTGPLKVVVYVPVGVKAEVVSVDDGFNGYGEEVMIVPSQRLRVLRTSVSFSVQATVPANRNDVLVTLLVTPDGGRTASVKGRTNAVLSVSSKVANTT